MSEIVNCEYSKTIIEEPVCNAFDVNRYGEIICSEENCIYECEIIGNVYENPELLEKGT